MSQEILVTDSGLPYIQSPAFQTKHGTPYLKEAGVAMIAAPRVDLSGVQPFLDGFDAELGFGDYLNDPLDLPPAERLVKFMGQGCYLSFGEGRSWNRDAERYFDNLKSSGHGSVFEHANFSLFFWGIDRSLTHELVRHRAGFGFSMVSQRYVDGTKLRFVERPEYQASRLPADAGEGLRLSVDVLHLGFEEEIDDAAEAYYFKAETLGLARALGHPMLQGAKKTEARKQVNQVAREGLPNSTEAPIGVTGNVRAWRHFCEQRANGAADVPIRELAVKAFRCLNFVSPMLFGDYEVEEHAASNSSVLSTPHRKV